jgi:dihydroorotase
MTLLIKSATLIDKSQPALHLKKRDILVDNGEIKRIGRGLSADRNTRVFEAQNLHVSPGWFDTGVSFGEPGYEERETISNGLRVAANAGFSGIVLNTNTNPTPDSSGDIVFLKEAAKDHCTELFPLGTLSVGRKGEDLSEMFDMYRVGAVGFSDYKTPLQSPNLLKLALLYAQNFGGLVHSFPLEAELAVHGQMNEGEVSVRLGLKGIPTLAEELRVARDISLLEYTGGRLHIPTISTAASVKLIASARKKGLDISCSVAVHHLWFTDETIEEFNSHFKVMPPLRDEKNRKSLQKALREGVIDFVTTDHCPLDVELKRREFDHAAFGATGLEEAFGILNQIYGPEISAEILSRGRQRFGQPEAVIKEGHRAVLTLFDPDTEYVLHEKDLKSHSVNSMFLGVPLKGRAYGVVVGDQTSF